MECKRAQTKKLSLWLKLERGECINGLSFLVRRGKIDRHVVALGLSRIIVTIPLGSRWPGETEGEIKAVLGFALTREFPESTSLGRKSTLVNLFRYMLI